jgi:hypothetical protein
MKTSRPSPLAFLSLALTLVSLAAGFGLVQDDDFGLSNDVGSQIARAGIEGEEIPVP